MTIAAGARMVVPGGRVVRAGLYERVSSEEQVEG